MLSAAPVVAQSLPLRLRAEAAGNVRVRGRGVQGVDWHAAGRSAVAVPLIVFDVPAEGVTVTIDGKPMRLDAADMRAAGPESDAALASLAAPPGPVFDDDAYALAALWTPGRSDATRRWTLTACGVVVLVLIVARYADPNRKTLWTLVAAAGLSGGAIAFFPTDAPRRELRADGRPGWDWVWRAGDGGEVVVEEAWTPGLRFVPRSPAHLASAEPTLLCDAAGRPTAVRCRVPRGGRAVFLRPRPTSPAPASASRP